MSNYHGQMMNIQIGSVAQRDPDEWARRAYGIGHRDARHAAAEIALAADQEIEALKQENHRLRAKIAMAAAKRGMSDA